jgi:hypothetical protein
MKSVELCWQMRMEYQILNYFNKASASVMNLPAIRNPFFLFAIRIRNPTELIGTIGEAFNE